MDSGHDVKEVEAGGAKAAAAAEKRGEEATKSAENILKFAPSQSAVDEGFWHRMASYKLETQRLEEQPIPVSGFFAPCSQPQIPAHVQLLGECLPPDLGGSSSMASTALGNRNKCPIPGTLYNTNTLETFNGLDKTALLKKASHQIWEDIHSGRAEEDSNLLSRFLLISFADLKKWIFRYWFAFPAIVITPPVTASSVKPVSELFTEVFKQLAQNGEASSASSPFFLLHTMPGGSMKSRPILDWRRAQLEGGKVVAAFYDPCNLRTNPGWPLRNLLALAVMKWGVTELQVLAYREKGGQIDLHLSTIINVELPLLPDWRSPDFIPEAVGWERNLRGRLGPRSVHLASTMDPKRHLCQAAADSERVKQEPRYLTSKSAQKVEHTGGKKESEEDVDSKRRRVSSEENAVTERKWSKSSSERGDRAEGPDAEADRSRAGPSDRRLAASGPDEASLKRYRDQHGRRDGHRDSSRVGHGSREQDYHQRNSHRRDIHRRDSHHRTDGERDRHHYKERDYQEREESMFQPKLRW